MRDLSLELLYILHLCSDGKAISAYNRISLVDVSSPVAIQMQRKTVSETSGLLIYNDGLGLIFTFVHLNFFEPQFVFYSA